MKLYDKFIGKKLHFGYLDWSLLICVFFLRCSLVISISGQASTTGSRLIFRILIYNWIFKTNSKCVALVRSSWKANGLCEVQELWSDAVIWSAGGASDRPSLIMNDRSDIYRCYKSSCFNYQGNRQNLHESLDFYIMMGWIHQGCQLSKSSESFVLNQNQMPIILLLEGTSPQIYTVSHVWTFEFQFFLSFGYATFQHKYQ